MLGIQTNTDQPTCLLAQIEKEASKCPSAFCSWVCPTSDYYAGLMHDVAPSHLCDEHTELSACALAIGGERPDIPRIQ